jgi:histidinol-phosphate aminotransferase
MSAAFDPTLLMRPHLRALVPYSSARHEFTGTAPVMLDANENAHGSPLGDALHRYPDPGQLRLRERFAKLHDLQAAQVLVGNGSDQVIDLLIRSFCEPGSDRIIVCPPTYGMYSVSAATNNVAVQAIPLGRTFQPDVSAILRAADERSKLLFLCSPNNPTGNLVQRQRIERLLRDFPGIVVVDEAYIEYSGTSGVLHLLKQHPKLVVMRTLSKAWGCAGLRVGFACASEVLISLLRRTAPPYNLGSHTEELALRALAATAPLRRAVQRSLHDRAALAIELGRSPQVLRVFHSDANFLLVRVKDPVSLLKHLREKGIVVRDRSHEPGCAGCLRMTVGTARENKSLLNAIRTWNT